MMLALAALLLSGCGKSGNKFANQPPTISITSYEGYDDSELLSHYADSLFSFQQKIFWNATDPDGVITGFAYRVKNQDGEPLPTPGNQYIDINGDITPQNVIDRFGTGWVMHYKTNADQSIPLDEPEASRTIWTSQKYATINFPAADENGNPINLSSTFEVIAIDNRGDITPVDPNHPSMSMAWRKFNAESPRPTCYLTTTKGNPGGGEVGSGIRLEFIMHDTDPFIPETPYRFQFKMMKIDPVTEATIAGTESPWYDSVTPEDPDLDNFLLTRYTTPSVLGTTNEYDVENGTTHTKTKIISRAYDMAGVVSAVSDSAAMKFAVKAGFRPKTWFYPQRVYALGSNHYIDYTDESTPEVLPFTFVEGAQRFATPFFVDPDSTGTARKTAVWSNNIKVWLRWGWWGEYGSLTSNNDIIYPPDPDPYLKKVDTVLDRTTGENYFSEITAFDLRLDGAPYNYQPYSQSIFTDGDGKRWLRVPATSPLGQTVVLTAQTPGEHTLEVRCVDLQNEVDPIPAVLKFFLIPPVAAADRSGVLVIDDDRANDSTSPEPIVLQKYQAMLADYSGKVDYLKRTNTLEAGDTVADSRLRHLATTRLQNYKLVIYHSDNPSETGELKKENDGLTLYLRSGGNMLISHTAQLSPVSGSFVLGYQRTFLGYFGLPVNIATPVSLLSNNLNSNAFFQHALGQTVSADAYPDIDLQYTAANEPSFNTLVNLRQGLSTIAYFPSLLPEAQVIYRMGIKPVGFTPGGPTQAQFDTYNNKPVGIRKITNGNRCYMLGFPLSYMQSADAKAFMNQVLGELGMM